MKQSKKKILKSVSENTAVITNLNAIVGKDDDGDTTMVFRSKVGRFDVRGHVMTFRAGFHVVALVEGMEVPEECLDDISIMLGAMNCRFQRGHFSLFENTLGYETFITCYDGRSMHVEDFIKEMMVPVWMIREHAPDVVERIEDYTSLHNSEYIIVDGE